MTKPHRVRWGRAVDRATQSVEGAIYDLEQTFEYNDHTAMAAGETKDEECERLAAICLRDAVGALEGAKASLGAAWTHINWEHDRKVRNWPLIAAKVLRAHADNLPPEVAALLADAPGLAPDADGGAK